LVVVGRLWGVKCGFEVSNTHQQHYFEVYHSLTLAVSVLTNGLAFRRQLTMCGQMNI
jgi:hypothetical protein